MKKITLICFVLIAQTVIGQTKATTENGKTVILSEDGTWKYEDDLIEEVVVDGDCDKYIDTQEDKVTGNSSTSAIETIIISQDGGKKGLGVFCLKSKNSVIMSIQAVGASNCIDDNGKMNILFRDGTRMELINDGKFNCDAKHVQYFGGVFGKKKKLEILKTKEIEVIRVWTRKGYVEETLTKEQSSTLMNTINCLSK